MHDTLIPNIMKNEFSRKVIQLRALVELGRNYTRKNPSKKYELLLITSSGKITGKYCELFCSDDNACINDTTNLDISKVDELANKVLIDAENELVNIKLVDNAEFIKLNNVSITPYGSGEVIKLSQLLVYADQITAFSLIEI